MTLGLVVKLLKVFSSLKNTDKLIILREFIFRFFCAMEILKKYVTKSCERYYKFLYISNVF